MAKKFVRNITNTRCKGRNQEPLETNRQNDILSDEHDVYVRNKDYYHCLTNAIQKIESKNDSIIVSKKDKNTVELEYVGGDGGGGTPGTNIPTEIISKSKYIDVEEVDTNKFELSTKQLEIELEEIRKLIEEMGNGDTGFIGGVPGYEFEYITDNEEIYEYEHYVLTFSDKNDKTFNYIKLHDNLRFVDVQLKKNATEININTHGDRVLDELGPLKAINVTVKFYNSREEDIPVNMGNYSWSVPPLNEDRIEYKQGSITVPKESSKEIHFTFYTDEESKVLRWYYKEGK